MTNTSDQAPRDPLREALREKFRNTYWGIFPFIGNCCPKDKLCESCELLVDKALSVLGDPPAPRREDGAGLIAAERARQITAEGWTPEHDDEHEGNELLQAAVWYLDNGAEFDFGLSLPPWPWEPAAWKPSDDRVRQLVKAGALIAAEIDRLKRRDAR